MNKKVRTIIYLMIVVIIAGGVYLWSQNEGDGVLGKLNPMDYDVTATCGQVEQGNLICNKGNDNYLCLDDIKVFLQNVVTVVEKNGDERTEISYQKSSLSELKQKTKGSKEASINLWLNSRGKVETLMIIQTSYENNNASLACLDGLDPSSFTASNTVLVMNKKRMRLAPINYAEMDKNKAKGLVQTYQFAKKVFFYHVEVTNIKNGTNKVYQNTKYSLSSYGEMQDKLSKGPVSAYIWLNEYGNIYAVMTSNEGDNEDA